MATGIGGQGGQTERSAVSKDCLSSFPAVTHAVKLFLDALLASVCDLVSAFFFAAHLWTVEARDSPL